MFGTRASAPISPPSPSSTLPTTAAATIARECHRQREREPVLVGRQDEEGARDDHEQRHREVRPEQEAVEGAEHPEALGNRLDAPGRRFDFGHYTLPSPA